MPRGFHFGRVRKRSYTSEYCRLSAITFKPLLESKTGSYIIHSERFSEQHKRFELIELGGQFKIMQFTIEGKKFQIGLVQDDSSVSNKLYITCPCCQSKRQHIYAIKKAYACRECLGLKYLTQSERYRDRLMRKIRKKRKALWGNDWPDVNNMFAHTEYWPKPKSVHWSTFEKAREEIYQLERQYWPQVDLFLNKQFEEIIS